jgi:multiple sugar transport system permease protein
MNQPYPAQYPPQQYPPQQPPALTAQDESNLNVLGILFFVYAGMVGLGALLLSAFAVIPAMLISAGGRVPPLGFLGALLLNAEFKGRAFLRTLNLLPWIIPGVVVGLVWEYLYQPNYGPINDILRRVGLLRVPIAWLSEPAFAMASVIFANIWRGIPFFSIMILAGLQAIPDEVYEAATVDGATVTQRFWHVTLPMLRPIIVVATATRVIWTFNYADLIFVMTAGGPANSTQITSTYTLISAYTDLDFGYAATLSVILLVIMLLFTAFYLKFTKGVQSVSG